MLKNLVREDSKWYLCIQKDSTQLVCWVPRKKQLIWVAGGW